MLRNGLLGIAIVLSLGLAQGGFTLRSPAFAGSNIPPQYTCAGLGQSPPLSFANLPAGTRSLAILGWDEDARLERPQPPGYARNKGGLAAQWVLYDLPASLPGLPAHIRPRATAPNFKQGQNSYGKLGYTAPCAKGKLHHLYFDLYALDVPSLGLPAGAGLAVVHAAIKRHRIQEAKLLGLVR